MVNHRREYIGTKMQILHVEFRITHPSLGIPEDLIQEMIHRRPGRSREGLGLYISHKLVTIMIGTVQYVRGEESSAFKILLEFPFARRHSSSTNSMPYEGNSTFQKTGS